MKKIILSLTAFLAILSSNSMQAQIPVYDHVIIVLEENYSYAQIIGSKYAPTITALSKTKYTANFTQAYANTHPSEPNYLSLFSGSEQGVTTDITGPASWAPFNDCNMGSSLIAAGYTFIGYSETQPSIGWTKGNSGNYATKHCPWINWMVGATSDSIPVNSDMPYSYFPDSLHYNTLPTVSWVIPNLADDMHNPASSSTGISNGDTWFKANIMPLIRWAVNHNTLVITTWDEDDGSHANNIPVLFSGSNIKGGNYSTPKFNHYGVLRTVETMYKLPYCDSSALVSDITGIWTVATGVTNETTITNDISIWPVPAKGALNMNITANTADKAHLVICDMTGRTIKEQDIDLKTGKNEMNISISNFANGIYFVNVKGSAFEVCKKFVVQN
jgi:hypothetical protein